MARVLLYDPNSAYVNGRIKGAPIEQAHTPDYEERPDALINPVLDAVIGVPYHYWVVDQGQVREMTEDEKNLLNAGLAADALAAKKTAIQAFKDQPEMIAALGAMLNLMRAQLNLVRQQPTTVFPAITAQQARTAFDQEFQAILDQIT